MEQLEPNWAPAINTTRRSLVAGALAGTAAGALSGGPAGALANNSDRHYSLPLHAYRIDLHSHFLPAAYTAFLISKGRGVVPWSTETHLAFMDAWKIQKSVVSAPIDFHFGNAAETRAVARGVNEAGRELLDAHGDRFAVHATLPLPDVAGSIEELGYAFDTLGLDGGVMLFSHYEGVYLGDSAYDDLYAELNRRELVVWVHPVVPVEDPVGPYKGGVVEFPFDTTRAAINIIYRDLLNRYPNIKWQFSHAGGTLPYLLHRLAYTQTQNPAYMGVPPRPNGPIADAQKLYYDTALAGSEEQLLSVDHLTGAPKIIFGSDWPFTAWMFAADAHQRAPWWEDLPTDGDPQPALSNVFNRSERMKIERKNARALYPGLVPA